MPPSVRAAERLNRPASADRQDGMCQPPDAGGRVVIRAAKDDPPCAAPLAPGRATEQVMADPTKVVTFDVDPASLASLRQAFPAWEVEETAGATTASLRRDWDPGTAALLVVGAGEEPALALGLCRGLRSQAGRARTPLILLVREHQEELARAALAAGADGCLVVPVHAAELVTLVARARDGNRPGRHTLGLHRAQREDLWRDAGGEA